VSAERSFLARTSVTSWQSSTVAFPSEYCHDVWLRKTRTMVKIFFEDIMFIRFDRIHERDKQTHRRTPHDGIGRVCIASRGKKLSPLGTKPPGPRWRLRTQIPVIGALSRSRACHSPILILFPTPLCRVTDIPATVAPIGVKFCTMVHIAVSVPDTQSLLFLGNRNLRIA